MKFERLSLEGVNIEFSIGGVNDEFHFMLKPYKQVDLKQQLLDIKKAAKNCLSSLSLTEENLVFARFFVSDYTNQSEIISSIDDDILLKKHCAVSVIQQPSLEGNKVVVWLYAISGDFQKKVSSHGVEIEKNGYKHYWDTMYVDTVNSGNSYNQTSTIMNNYLDRLHERNLSLKDNCLRTWFFVRDVDKNYQGVVESRKAIFDKEDLTTSTHYIASTGIEGRHCDINTDVMMDAYAVDNISSDQIKQLQALEYLNPTHEYGVTFERGTSIDFGDRRHIYISGTASIDKFGEVVHENQIDKQIDRTIENIRQLLIDAGAELNDLAQVIVYLRDVADSNLVEQRVNELLPNIPKVIVWAPVCRPGWLIEIEGIAIKSLANTQCNNF